MRVRIAAAAALALIVGASARGQDPAGQGVIEDKDPFRVHIRMHRKIAPKVVFVRGGGQSGTGVVIRSDGIILTSPTACGIRTTTATVILPGYKRVEAKVIDRRNDLELALLKIEAKDLPAMEFADSSKARVGQVAYAFGDVFQSIEIDDQVAMSFGIVSGLYEVTAALSGSIYTGPVIETSAAVNPNLDGGPLVDAEGKLLGLITLNYHPAKFTGIAVPAHILKPEVTRMLKDFADGVVRKNDGYVGIRVEDSPGLTTGVQIINVVAGSPAEKAGLKVGDQIVRIDSDHVTSLDRFEELTQGIRPSTRIRFRVRRDGKEQDVTVTAGRRDKPEPKPEY